MTSCMRCSGAKTTVVLLALLKSGIAGGPVTVETKFALRAAGVQISFGHRDALERLRDAWCHHGVTHSNQSLLQRPLEGGGQVPGVQTERWTGILLGGGRH